MLIAVEGYNEQGVVICPNDTLGESIEIGGLHIVLPATPENKDIAYPKAVSNADLYDLLELIDMVLDGN